MKLKTLDYFVIVLVLATAALHFAAAFDPILFKLPSERPDITFTLNGLGYLGLLGAFYLPIPFFQQRHKLVWQVLFGYIILTIVAWLVIWVGMNVIAGGMPFFSHDSIYGVPAKIIELVLLYLLWQEKH